ncbi:MAG: TolC family protein [Myxococcota bacterium]
MVFGSILNQESFSPALDFNNVPWIDNLNLRTTVRAPIYAGGRRLAARDAAIAAGGAAKHQAEAVRNDLSFHVARAFFDILKAKALVRATDAATDAFEQNLEIAKHRFAAGTLLKQQLLDVEVGLAQVQEQRLRAHNAQALAQHALVNIMGLEQDGIIEIEDDPWSTGTDVNSTANERPELLALQQGTVASDAALKAARADRWPSLAAFGSLMFDHGFRQDNNGMSYLAGVALQWSAFDGLATRARVSQAESLARTTREQLRQTRLALRFELAQSRIHIRDADERLEVTAKAITLAEESAALGRARFEEGLAIATQLIDAESALTAARLRHAEAEADRRVAIAALYRAMGKSIAVQPRSEP